MHVVAARFYHIVVHIFLILKKMACNTRRLNRLVAVEVDGYVHTHTIKLYHIYLCVCVCVCVIIPFYKAVLYRIQFCLFSTCMCL